MFEIILSIMGVSFLILYGIFGHLDPYSYGNDESLWERLIKRGNSNND